VGPRETAHPPDSAYAGPAHHLSKPGTTHETHVKVNALYAEEERETQER
jgi:hypothetical protein